MFSVVRQILQSKKKICILCLNLNTEPVFKGFKHRNALFKHKSCVWLNLCVQILFVFKCFIFVFHFFLLHTYFMTAIKYISVFFVLFCRLAMVKYVLSLTNLLQQPGTVEWLMSWSYNREVTGSNPLYAVSLFL